MTRSIILIIIAAFTLSGCGEDNPVNSTVTDELFYQKEYDSVYYPPGGLGGISTIHNYVQLRVKKIKITFELYSTRTDSNVIRLSAGHYPNYWWDTTHISGLHTFEHVFPTTQDSTDDPVYTLTGRGGSTGSYIVVRNFKAYRSY